VQGYGLTTANILHRRPDHPWLLQSYVWQNYDLYPDFPEVQGFLKFWQKSLEGVLHSVMVAHSRLIKPVEIKTSTHRSPQGRASACRRSRPQSRQRTSLWRRTNLQWSNLRHGMREALERWAGHVTAKVLDEGPH
jgi:uncharacterized protein Usg